MEKLKIKIHPTFIVFACILIYFGQSFLFFNYLAVMFLHELSHAMVARRLGYNIKNIKLIPFGICLNISSIAIQPKDEIKIALAGPIINYFLALITIACWWVFPGSYNFSYIFCYANFITATFNLMPAFPLDGGRVVLAILKQKMQFKKAVKLCKIFNVVICCILLLFFVFSLFSNPNLTYLFVTFCLFSGIFENNKGQSYSFISSCQKIGKTLLAKHIVISQEEKLFKVCKFVDNFSFLILSVLDEQKNIVATFTETEVFALLQSFSASTPFKIILKVQKKS